MSQGAVFLCQPCYGLVDPRSAKQFWARATDPAGPYKDLPRVYPEPRGSSLLANLFNSYWCEALNAQRGGVDVRYFAMLHADIIPADGWLDQLLHDLEETGADLMAAVCPLKDSRGLTSTAIDDPEDPWCVYRRLTLTEVHALPEVFGAADCGYPDRLLLANTGCWICRFDRPWRFRVHFEINDRVVFRAENSWCMDFGDKTDEEVGYVLDGECGKGSFQAQGMSEDWNFSRQLGRLGGKVLCTRRVALKHMGENTFPNSEPWGEFKEDENTASKWRQNGTPTARRPGILSEQYPDVEGWLTDGEGRALARLATAKNVLEIGSFCGRSTLWLARTAEHVCAVDTFDSRGIEGLVPHNTLGVFQANLEKYGVREKVSVKYGESAVVLPSLCERFDLCFIDGAHDEDSVNEDAILCLGVLRRGGLLVFHDYHSSLDPDVTTVVNRLVAGGARLVEVVGSLAVIRPADHQYRSSAAGWKYVGADAGPMAEKPALVEE
jgi:hypothetical protein